MNEMKIFQFENDDLRTVDVDGTPWFVATDVCKVLDIKNVTQAVSVLNDNQRSMLNIGRQGKANCVNEYGLYKLIFKSRKPEAEQFQDWVTDEVLPSIRRTGSYQQPMSVEDMIIAQAQSVNEVKEKVTVLETKVDNQITLDHGEQRMLQKAVARKVYELSDDTEERPQLFRQAYREIKDRFAVSSYKDVKRKDLQRAVSYIQNWVPKQIA